MLENFTDLDYLKITITVVSLVSLYLFRRRIQKIISDILIGGDSNRYNGKTVSEIMDQVESRLDEVIG